MKELGVAGFMLGAAAMLLWISVVIISPWAWEDHTHESTGIQDGAFVCLGGKGAVDYDLTTTRPFIVCGNIEIVTEEKGPPPLGSNTHLAQ